VKELKESIQTILADVKSNELFEVTNAYKHVSTKDLIEVLNAISEKHYFSGGNFENGLDELMLKIAEVESYDSVLDP
ncbi:hypothetical protein ACKI1O_54170, partial [Streptomyces scabiei]